MPQQFTVSSLARRFRVPPRQISDLFYARKLSDEVCPVVEGRRLIPESYISSVELALRQHGWLPADSEVAHV